MSTKRLGVKYEQVEAAKRVLRNMMCESCQCTHCKMARLAIAILNGEAYKGIKGDDNEQVGTIGGIEPGCKWGVGSTDKFV